MSGETERDVSGWTTDTLHTLVNREIGHLRDLIDGQKEAATLALTATREEMARTDRAYEKRFDLLNEFRGQTADMAKELMTRAEALAEIRALSAKIESQHETVNQKIDGVVSGLNEKFAMVQEQVNVTAAVARGRALAITSLVTIITVLVAVAGVILTYNQ